jgi:hypothetical protein
MILWPLSRMSLGRVLGIARNMGSRFPRHRIARPTSARCFEKFSLMVSRFTTSALRQERPAYLIGHIDGPTYRKLTHFVRISEWVAGRQGNYRDPTGLIADIPDTIKS